MLLFTGELGEFYKKVNSVFAQTFKDRIIIQIDTFSKNRVSLLAILIDIQNFHNLYCNVIVEDAVIREKAYKTEGASAKEKDEKLSDSYKALSSCLQQMQCKLLTTYILIQNSQKVIYRIVA